MSNERVTGRPRGSQRPCRRRPRPVHATLSVRQARTGNVASKYTYAQAHATRPTPHLPLYDARDDRTAPRYTISPTSYIEYNNIIWRSALVVEEKGVLRGRGACVFSCGRDGTRCERYKTNICPTGCVRCVTAPSSVAVTPRRGTRSVFSLKNKHERRGTRRAAQTWGGRTRR